MTDTTSPTAELSAARRQHLARRPVARANRLRRPAEAHRRPQRRRRHHQPDDLRRRTRQGRRVRRPGRRARQGRHQRDGCRLRDHHERRRRTRATIFAPVYEESGGKDGRVSIEVEPGLAHDAEGTTAEAKRLWAKVDKPNAMIKIPATIEGLTAITETIAAGISVNVTLIFSLERHRQVINAYLTGLEKAKAAGHDLSKIYSVASFFVSRVDTEINNRLDAIGTEEAIALKSQGGRRERPARLRGVRRGVRVGARQGAARRRRQQAATAVGIDGCQGPEPARHALRDRARRGRRRQHHAGEDARGDLRPRRHRGRHGHRQLRRRPTPCSTPSPSSASRTTR